MNRPNDLAAIGVDLGGTKVLAGKVVNGQVTERFKTKVPGDGTEKEVITVICEVIDRIFDESIDGIGVGAPSVVDIKRGIVYDVQNIPSWKEVHLKDILEDTFEIPVSVNNDANCFAIGEKYFGIGRNYKSFAALIVGTGLAAGIIINDKLYNGNSCGAGEFGMIPYIDHHYEYYSCGQFFTNVYNIDGQTVYKRAMQGDKTARSMFEEMGTHLGNAINAILYSVDPEIIIMGGSVSRAYPLFKRSLWKSIEKNVYHTMSEKLKIKVSSNPDIAILGAAALYYDTLS